MSNVTFRPSLGRYTSDDVPRVAVLAGRERKNDEHARRVREAREFSKGEIYDLFRVPNKYREPEHHTSRLALFLARHGNELLVALAVGLLGGFIGWALGTWS